jgi:hypothetical protein
VSTARRALGAALAAFAACLLLAAGASAQAGSGLRLVKVGTFASPLYAIWPPADPLRRRYLYSDLCDGRIWATRLRTGTAPAGAPLRLPKLEQVSSFGEDASGRIYVTSILGAVYRIAAARGGRPR